MASSVRVLALIAFVLSVGGGCAKPSASTATNSRPDHATKDAGNSRPRGKADDATSHASTDTIDLSIVFDSHVTGSVGWVKLPNELPLEMIGTRGAELIDLTRLPFAGDDKMQGRLIDATLRASALVDASLVVNANVLCSLALRDAIAKKHPSRLMISVEGGITEKAVSCLGALSTSRIYLAGCLYRGHRPDACDGDAELHALASDVSVRSRIHGLAVSLVKPEAVAELGNLTALEYIALSPGAPRRERPLVEDLPFAALRNVRYLEASGENDHARPISAEARRFIGQLHTLRWNGELRMPLSAQCRLERASFDMIKSDDMDALAPCKSLRELSTDETRFDSAMPIAVFADLEHLHLRHWEADDLALLVALTKLRGLSLPASKAKDFSFVAGMTQLRSVDLSQTSLSSLASFRGLTSLESLDVGFTTVSDLTPLRRASKLAALNLHDTNVFDLTTLTMLGSLKALNISKAKVVDLGPLHKHPSLENVTLYETKVSDASALLTLPKLKRANVKGVMLPKDQVDGLRKRLGDQLFL